MNRKQQEGVTASVKNKNHKESFYGIGEVEVVQFKMVDGKKSTCLMESATI